MNEPTKASTAIQPTFSGHYISGTHWDREWYRPFQEFRVLLVRLLDDLLDLMERDADFKYFQLDGQTCIIEDYLEIRPENRERLKKLMHEGRILAGPWFTMPDLFCVGDEALVRNLLLGRRICREWGVEPMPVGFICDMFGHPSQIPQIFAGFGLNDVVLGRGTNESTSPTYFTWGAPDGSTVFTFKLQDAQGYGAFAIPRTALGEKTFVLDQLEMAPFRAALEATAGDPAAEARLREEWFRVEMAKYVDHETERANGDVVCLMDSMDHIPPATEVARNLKLIHEACPSVRPVHSNLPAFFADARSSARNVPVKHGELREPGKGRNSYLYLIPNCVSARVRLKRANDAAQNLLEKWAEPLMAFANLRGAKIPETYLRVAWSHVLLNQAHDSICGCSIDQVHRDMMYRYDQAIVLGEQLAEQCLEFLTRDAAELGKSKDDFTLVLFNPLPHARDEVVQFDVDLLADYPTEFTEGFFSEKLKSFILEDAEGNTVPYQRLSMAPHSNERSRLAQFCFQTNGAFERYRVAAKIDLPAAGYTSLRVRPSVMPVRTMGSLRTGPASAQNEYLTVAIASNGTLTLTDRVSGQAYTDLLTFEDRSEIGDGWFHNHALNDEQLLSTAGRAKVSVVHDGPELVTFRVTATMDVPARYDSHARRPMPETVPLVISSLISLRRGARVIEVETTVHNNAQDHRLRLLLPTDTAGAENYLAHHPYDFVSRPIAVDAQTHDWQEMDIPEKPFLHIQAVGAGERGLAFLSEGGLHEGGVMDDHRRTMLVTLLRSFRRTVATGGETDGLEIGEHVYRFALMPYAGELPREAALRELANLQAGLLTRQSGARPSGFPALTGTKTGSSLVEQQTGRLIISALKPREAGGGLVVRLWNPTGLTQSETLHFTSPVRSAKRLKLSEEIDETGPVPEVAGGFVTVEAGPHQIVTVEIGFAAEERAKVPEVI